MAQWKIDPDHSVATFSVRHLIVANVHGQFNKISGTIKFNPDDISHASVTATIDVSGIYTGIKKRDDHLRSPDFLDVEKYPEINFKSTKAESTGGNRCEVTGDLTIHGITRAVTLDVEFFGPVKSPYGGEITMGFSALTMIDREDFGMTWNEPLESGGVMVGKEVYITLDIEADKVSD